MLFCFSLIIYFFGGLQLCLAYYQLMMDDKLEQDPINEHNHSNKEMTIMMMIVAMACQSTLIKSLLFCSFIEWMSRLVNFWSGGGSPDIFPSDSLSGEREGEERERGDFILKIIRIKYNTIVVMKFHWRALVKWFLQSEVVAIKLQ